MTTATSLPRRAWSLVLVAHRADPWTAAALSAGLLACASAPPPAPAVSPPGASTADAAAPTTPAPPDLRALAPDASFAELVQRVEQLDGLAQEASERACVMAADTAGYRLEAELAVAVRPPPPPPADLDARLADAPQLEVFTRYGRIGKGALTAVALTASVARPSAALLVHTDRGYYLLDGAAKPSLRGPVALEALAESLAALATRAEPPTLYLTAEASSPLRDVYSMLEASAALGLPVALVSVLPAGTRLPAPPQKAQAPLCPEGLPASEAPAGELDLPSIRQGLAPFLEAAKRCAETAGGGAALGGRLDIALRVGEDGAVQDSCLLQDAVGEPALASCLTRQASRAHFAPPSPAGVVDLHVPLRIAASEVAMPAPVCEATLP